eukprot:m.160753 g.160753  ORF g.160753 m.160753 type:complete len:142 (-) comp18038_c0_seq6:445-870(-)
MAAKDQGKADVNMVHANARLVETIKKEERTQRIHTQFACNPKTVVTVTGKPNVPDRVDGDISEALELLNSTTKSPKEKYGAPLTASQEYGWDTEYAQRSDLFNYGRKSSEITGHMDAFFKQQVPNTAFVVHEHVVLQRKTL